MKERPILFSKLILIPLLLNSSVVIGFSQKFVTIKSGQHFNLDKSPLINKYHLKFP
jgi:hypothetical protein